MEYRRMRSLRVDGKQFITSDRYRSFRRELSYDESAVLYCFALKHKGKLFLYSVRFSFSHLGGMTKRIIMRTVRDAHREAKNVMAHRASLE